jgi:SprT protein
MAYYRDRAIGLSNSVITNEEQLRDTLLHEYAHLLAVSRHGKQAAGHGWQWQQAMRDLGLEPKVRHNYQVRRNSQRQEVAYKCEKCGKLLIRARRLPRKRRYAHVDCGGLIRLAWARPVTPAEPAP